MFAIFRNFSRLVAAVIALVDVIEDLVEVQRAAGPAVARLEALELSRHQFEAEVEGSLLAATGKLKAARSSEERERHIKKANERLTDSLADDGEEAPEGGGAVLSEHVAAGEAERLQALRLDVAPDRKAAAVAAKWSR